MGWSAAQQASLLPSQSGLPDPVDGPWADVMRFTHTEARSRGTVLRLLQRGLCETQVCPGYTDKAGLGEQIWAAGQNGNPKTVFLDGHLPPQICTWRGCLYVTQRYPRR